jgi:hypothetical protein
MSDLQTLPADHLLVEDVMLLLFQPDSGTIAGENILFYVLGGAVLAELALDGSVEPRASGIATRVHALDTAAPADAILAPAWNYIAEKPRAVQTVLAATGPTLREPVLDRLVERGDMVRTSKKTLGIFTTSRLTLASELREQLMDRVRAALIDGEKVDARTAAAIALLSASGTLSWFHREVPWSGDVYTRGKEFEQGNWAASAAGIAVARTTSGVAVNSAIAAAATQR